MGWRVLPATGAGGGWCALVVSGGGVVVVVGSAAFGVVEDRAGWVLSIVAGAAENRR
jgi:hypothetical protein